MAAIRKYVVVKDTRGGRVFWDGSNWVAYVGAAKRYDSEAQAKKVARENDGKAMPLSSRR